MFISIEIAGSLNVWKIGIMLTVTTLRVGYHYYSLLEIPQFPHKCEVTGAIDHEYNRENQLTYSLTFESQNFWTSPRSSLYKGKQTNK